MNFKIRTIAPAALLSLLVLCGGAYSQVSDAATAVNIVPPFTATRLAAFDKVWNTVNEKHYDPTFGGVDWAKVRVKYLPMAQAANSDEAFHGVLRQMLGELGLSHFNVFPPPPEINGGEGNGKVGVSVIWLDGKAVVQTIAADSSSAAAGVKTGSIVNKIDGKPVVDLLRPLQESFAKRTLTDGLRRLYLERTVEALLSGKAGTMVKVEMLTENGKVQDFDLRRQAFQGEMSQPLGNFPKQEVIFESRMLTGNVGYIRFNMWVIPQMPKIRAAMKEFALADAVIFDLRGNPGGVGGLAAGTAGLISDKQISLGSMTSRGGSMSLIGYPQANPFLGKVIVLADHGSASTSEMFASGLQENGRAKVVGETTAGAILLSVFEKLPTGYMFQYAISDYRSPGDVLIEGRGVVPDVQVSQTREALSAGRDLQLDAALELAKK